MAKNDGYGLEAVRAAFWATFHECGKRWFPYMPEGNEATEDAWKTFHENLATARRARLWCAREAVKNLFLEGEGYDA